MDGDPSQIPVVPIPFKQSLVRFAQSLARGQAKVVAIVGGVDKARSVVAAPIS
jgi:hypothetical protein